jgi:hypothetical protein
MWALRRRRQGTRKNRKEGVKTGFRRKGKPKGGIILGRRLRRY